MKRVLSFVLALSLIAGLMTGLTLTASAETIIPEIAITGVAEPVVGQEPTIAGISTSDAYTQDISWSVWDNSGYRGFDDGETFANGKVYRLDISLWINDGYQFADKDVLTVSVNGNPITDFEHDRDWARFELIYTMDGVTVLDQVVIESLPAVQAGTSTDLAAGVTLPAGANYTVQGTWYKNAYVAEWNDYGWEWYQGATLEDGEHYYLELTITPNEGYWIGRNTEVKVNGEVQPYWSNSFNGGSNLNVDYDFRPVVKSVDLTTSGVVTYGAALNTVTVTAPDGVNYTVDAKWQIWDGSNGGYVATTGNFGYGEYRLEVTITPKEGYTILMDNAPTINGRDYYEAGDWHEDDIDGNYENGFIMVWNVYVEAENGYIHEVDLSGAPDSITAGANITAPNVTVVDGDITVTGAKWLSNEMEPVTGKFEDGKSYYLAIDVAAKAGYAFEGWLEAYMNDEACYGCNVDNSRTSATVYVYYTLKPVIEKVELTVTVPVVGAAPGAVTLPSGAKYVFDSNEEDEFPGYSWYMGGGDPFQKFENGKKYYMDAYLLPAEGCEFASDVVVTINGVAVEENNMYCNGTNLSIMHSWSFRETIKNVNITTPDYKVGDVFKREDITLPAGVGCETGYVGMYGNYTDPYVAIGKDRYNLNVELYAKEGYEFSEDCVVTINGKTPNSSYGGETYQDIYYVFSLCEQITKVELPAFPAAKVGDTAQYQDLVAPNGAKYYLYSYWTDSTMSRYDGTLAANTAYYLQYIAQPMEGYEFSEDCVITIDGQPANLPIMLTDYETAGVAKLYNFGMPAIDKVELTITAPADGQKPSTTVKLPDGAKYEIPNISWYESKSGDTTGQDWEFLDRRDTFSYGNYYFAVGSIELKEGYIFAEDAKLFINGKAVEMEVGPMGTYLAGNQGQIFYRFDKLEEVYDDNPKTGITGIGVLSAMMVLSATAAGIVISKKKEF